MRKFLMVSLLLLSTTANADIVNLTVTGHIAPYTWNGGYTSNPLVDNGTFGQAGRNLFGDAFTAHWTINTGCITCDYVSGYGVNNPIMSATLAINGVTVSYGTALYGVTYDYPEGSSYDFNMRQRYSAFYVNVTETSGQRAMNQFINSFAGSFPGDINQPFSYDLNPATDQLNTPLHLGGSFSYGGLAGYLFTEHIERTNPAFAVPGPIAGTGLPGLLAAIALLAWRKIKKAPAV